jgi:hypothetical protein
MLVTRSQFVLVPFAHKHARFNQRNQSDKQVQIAKGVSRQEKSAWRRFRARVDVLSLFGDGFRVEYGELYENHEERWNGEEHSADYDSEENHIVKIHNRE